jgi:hypothetical protein
MGINGGYDFCEIHHISAAESLEVVSKRIQHDSEIRWL